MTKISSAPPYPTCSGYFSRSRSVCQWTNSLRDMNLVASKTGSPGVTPHDHFCSILSIPPSPRLAFLNHLRPTHHSNHIISRAASINRFYRQCSAGESSQLVRELGRPEHWRENPSRFATVWVRETARIVSRYISK